LSQIDRSFTNAITTSSESKALVATLVQLGKDLGLKTIAEGVETLYRVKPVVWFGHTHPLRGILPKVGALARF
jgi:sensor c-di-GMP phosphodiesterase-like protein